MGGLMAYLAGPGRHNEHTDPHLVVGDPAIMTWHDDAELSARAAQQVAQQLDAPRRLLNVNVPGGAVWHCSLSVAAEEGQLGDQQWAAIATDFVEGMGFVNSGGRADCRWVAVHHGLSSAGNDHIHLAVSLVREDGTKADVWRDWPRAQELAGKLERKYGLEVLESRGIGMGQRGTKRAEQFTRRETPAAETVRTRLERTVRATVATSGTEAEFVRGLRAAGLLVRPRFAEGTHDVVVGFSAAVRPPQGEQPLWFGGGRLARDLTLPRLRENWPDTPGAATEAAAEWQAAWRGKPPATASATSSSTPDPDPALWKRYAEEVKGLRKQLVDVSPADVATWSRVAHQLSGAFSAWSLAAEGDRPGPLAATARVIGRTAQVPRQRDAAAPGADWGPSMRGASLLLSSAAKGGRGPVGQAVLLKQLANTAKALYDAHAAAGRPQEARRIASAVLTDLEQVRKALPSPEEPRSRVEQRAAQAGPSIGGGRPRPPGSPVPGHLQPHRVQQDTSQGVER